MKKYFIEAKVKVMDGLPYTAEVLVSDMLRYDLGEIIGKRNERLPDKHYDLVYLNIWCHRYTKARWDSFGIETKELEMIKKA